MTGGAALLTFGALVAVLFGGITVFCWLVKQMDRPGPWIAALVVLWLIWEMIPGSHAVMGHLWADLQLQLGQLAQQIKGVL